MSENKFSSITDIPIHDISEELLDIGDYSSALVNFINNGATPLTIGIQGEWGSGKSSLMYLIKNDLENQNIATAWVNTWEYSLFRTTEESIPAILKGLLENLKRDWKGKLPDAFSEKLDKVAGFMKGLAKVTIDTVVEKATGAQNITDKAGVKSDSAKRVEIVEIREKIQEIINEVIEDPGNSCKKIVFFIDDLDRIDPSLAVQILESLKNIFDIKNCVYVLAIDYEVVVKGLKSKFGEKTPENEREFRSFFDKIIQVPFTMPISMYNIERFIEDRFNALGYIINNEIKSGYIDIAKYTVGTNPRSIKRYINTYSLLKSLFDLKNEPDDSDDKNNEIKDFALFAFVGIQIAFPKIYNLILNDEDYINWDDNFSQRYLGDDIEQVPEEYKKNELYDEKWEQIIWSYCQKDSYLKIKCNKIIIALNKIREVIQNNDDLGSIISDVLQFTNITSVGEDEGVSEGKYKKVRLAGWDEYYRNRIEKGSDKKIMLVLKDIHDFVVEEFTHRGIKINYTPHDLSFQANVRARKKVFLYCRLRKKYIDFWAGKQHLIYNSEDFTDEIKSKIEKNYISILENVKK